MTIGVGFFCSDGIVLASDTQITWPANHKYYESKLYLHNYQDYGVVFTFAGNPNLMKSFNGKFKDNLQILKKLPDAATTQNLIEHVLSMMDIVDSDPDGLDMLGAVSTVDEIRLIRTQRKVVSQVTRFDYVGVGDSSLLRYLSPMLTRYREFKVEPCIHLATYLVLQAKRYVDGCGGDTNLIIMESSGKGTYFQTYNIEQRLLKLEHHLTNVASSFFYPNDSQQDFEDILARLNEALKSERPEIMRLAFQRSARTL